MSRKTRRRNRRKLKRKNLLKETNFVEDFYEVVYKYRGGRFKYIERIPSKNIEETLKEVKDVFEIISIWKVPKERLRFLQMGGIETKKYMWW